MSSHTAADYINHVANVPLDFRIALVRDEIERMRTEPRGRLVPSMAAIAWAASHGVRP